MTIDRDDPLGGHAAEDPAGPKRHGFERADEELFDWAISTVGVSLLQDGLSLSVIVPIVREGVHVYARFRKNVKKPRKFVVRQILARAREYVALRGLPPRSAAEKRLLHLLHLIGTREAMATLPAKERKALEVLFIEKKPLEALAAELDLSVVAAELLGRRAVARLSAWKPRGPEES